MNDYYETDLTPPFLQIMNEKWFPDPPKRLWVRGKLPSCDDGRPKTAAIVGARRCTTYGESIAYKLAYDLAKRGVIIVSGMAYGIDACAHRGCLDAGGTTIAVLGTPIDQLYPTSNIGLARRILEKGAILSEYEPGFSTKSYCFLQRNRIVTGLSDVVVIVEASEKSGTKHTANMADDQHKKVFAVPGDITRPMSAGCNKLILNGCGIFTSILDVLAALGLGPKDESGQMPLESIAEEKVVEAIKKGNNTTLDIIKETKYSTAELTQILMQLEMKDIIENTKNNCWMLA